MGGGFQMKRVRKPHKVSFNVGVGLTVKRKSTTLEFLFTYLGPESNQ